MFHVIGGILALDNYKFEMLYYKMPNKYNLDLSTCDISDLIDDQDDAQDEDRIKFANSL